MATGKPDYYKQAANIKASIGSNQARFWWQETVDLNALTYTVNTVYTVPAGKKLFITGAACSCEASFITLYRCFINGVSFLSRWYNINDFFSFGDSGAMVIEAGGTLDRAIYNYDTSAREFRFTFIGFEEDA